MPRLASVAGVVRVGGVPRRDIRLRLVDGGDDGLDAWIAQGLRSVGLSSAPSVYSESSQSTKADGTFRFEGLLPSWTGELFLAKPEDHRLVGGADRIELARPEEGLVLELEALRPEAEVHGRAVFAGEAVPLAGWSWNGDTSGECDELGRFSFHAFEDELEGSRLQLSKPDVGKGKVELRHGLELDLGDVELLPTREVRFLVRSESGAPIVGARAAPRTRTGPTPFDWVARAWRRSEPTDAAGWCTLGFLAADEREFRVSARGYASMEVLVPETDSDPVPVVLTRCAALLVEVRDRAGRVPRDLRVRLEATGPPFTWDDGFQPAADERTHEGPPRRWKRVGQGISDEYGLDARGRAWIDRLRSGTPFDLSVVDDHGSEVAPARELVLGESEWRRLALCVETEPRTLVVRVRDTFDRPLARAWLELVPAKPGSRLYTNRAGMARSELLYRDEVTLSVGREGFETRTLEHVAIPREGATIDVRLAHDWWPW